MIMKLKKSDSNRWDKKQHLSSQSQSLLSENDEDAFALLSGREMVPAVADFVTKESSNDKSNNTTATGRSKSQKRHQMWRSALGFRGGGVSKDKKPRDKTSISLNTPKHLKKAAATTISSSNSNTPTYTTTSQDDQDKEFEAIALRAAASPFATNAAAAAAATVVNEIPVAATSKQQQAATRFPGFEVSFDDNNNNDDALAHSSTSVSNQNGAKVSTSGKVLPASPVTSSTNHERKKPKKSSPVARAAALALVKGGSVEHNGNFDENDFHGNEGTLEEIEKVGQDDNQDTFIFDRAENNVQQGSGSSSKRRTKNAKEQDDNGIEILSQRSFKSGSKSPKEVMTASQTLPTVCSTQSSITSGSLSSPASNRSSNGGSTTSPFSPKLSQSASMMSQHTKTSTPSSLFSFRSRSSFGSSQVSTPTSTATTPSSSCLQHNPSLATPSTTDGRTSTPFLQKKEAQRMLSRPFGRHSLSSMPWSVEVAPAEWDNLEQNWKYRIQVRRGKPSSQNKPLTPSSSVAVVWRSIDNFVWLEHALNTEFQGGLVLPLLSIAVGMTDLDQMTHEIDSNLLQSWLYDVLNGIRGQGEFLLGDETHPETSLDLFRSEAVEAFLYRNKAPLQKPTDFIHSMMGDSLAAKRQQLEDQERRKRWLRQKQEEDEEAHNCHQAMCKPIPQACSPESHTPALEGTESFVTSFMKGPLSLITEELCVVMGCQNVDYSPSSVGTFVSSPGKRFGRYSSQALSTANTLDIQDSFLDASTLTLSQSSTPTLETPRIAPKIWKRAQNYDLILSERNLMLSFRKSALLSMEQVQVLMEEEEQIGLTWKRFCIAVSNLFSFEKEVEKARLGDKKIHRGCMPYEKVKKATVDQSLRAIAQRKGERSIASLKIIHSMLSAYVADLSAVGPSVDAYLEGISEMAAIEELFEKSAPSTKKLSGENGEEKSEKDGSLDTTPTTSTSRTDTSGTLGHWQEKLTELAQSSSRKFVSAKNLKEMIQNKSTSSTDSSDAHEKPVLATELQQKGMVEDRVLSNERLLKESLTALCKATSFRGARMAYAYFKSEANQCVQLRTDAKHLRDKIDVANKDTVAKMNLRHQDENKEDMKLELSLAQRMVALGNTKKFVPSGSPCSEETIEVDTDKQDDDRAGAEMRDQALQIARERVGRWNSDLAMAIMKAVGVDDPNVRVEETTRELRLVRKYAIGLREHLNCCIDAVDALRNAILKGQYKGKADTGKRSPRPIRESRKEYFSDLFTLFSCVAPRDNLSSVVNLSEAGINLKDPLGWSNSSKPSSPKKYQCGKPARSYVDLRDAQTEWLLSHLSALLNDYTQRVEIVESFVYMECVGVQLEKYFSKRRSHALSGTLFRFFLLFVIPPLAHEL